MFHDTEVSKEKPKAAPAKKGKTPPPHSWVVSSSFSSPVCNIKKKNQKTFLLTEAVTPKEKIKPVILKKGKTFVHTKTVIF